VNKNEATKNFQAAIKAAGSAEKLTSASNTDKAIATRNLWLAGAALFAADRTMTAQDALLMVVGGLTKFWAAVTLGDRAYYWYNFFTTERAPLNTRGPYRFLKNPMYTVGYLPLYGLALFTMSLPGLVAAVFDQAAILMFHRWVEEPHFERWSGGAAREEAGRAD